MCEDSEDTCPEVVNHSEKLHDPGLLKCREVVEALAQYLYFLKLLSSFPLVIEVKTLELNMKTTQVST